ncbi:MAG TPA: MCE family protein [Frankiaceae bacterium]|nr:MCE family protein [Frankiaceae bacterium]
MRTTWRRVVQGLVFLVVIAMLVGLTVLKFQRRIFSPQEVAATLRVDKAGTQLNPDADVKVRGIIVGRVAKQATDGQRATLTLKIRRDQVRYVPSSVVARILPKTLFGEKYVDLVIPPGGETSAPISDGAVIPQDTSHQAIEVERVLADLFPLLRALEPEELNAALTAIAEGLEGRGEALGKGLENLDAYLNQLNPKLPAIQRDLSALAELTENLEDNAEDILRIARNSVVSGRTLTEKEDSLAAFLRGTTGFSDELTELLRRNGDALIYLADASRRTLAAIYPKRDVLPDTIKGLNLTLTELNAALNHGPALSIRLEPVDTRGGYYVPCRYPDPAYRGGCDVGRGDPDPEALPVPKATPAGVPNSPEERETVRQLVAPEMGVAPSEVPDLAVLIMAPLLRGALVTTQ